MHPAPLWNAFSAYGLSFIKSDGLFFQHQAIYQMLLNICQIQKRQPMLVGASLDSAYRIYRFRLEGLLKIPTEATYKDLPNLIAAGLPASIFSTFVETYSIPIV